MKTKILSLILVLLVAIPQMVMAAPSQETIDEILKYTRDFLMEESKNSGIFSLKHPENGQEEWFELYGILGDVKEFNGKYVVTVDVDLFGYDDSNYLLYFIVVKESDQYKLDEIQIGPRFDRNKSQKLSIPE